MNRLATASPAAGGTFPALWVFPHCTRRSPRRRRRIGKGFRIVDTPKAALEALAGDAEDSDKLLAAGRRVTLTDAPSGPVSLKENGHPLENIYGRNVAPHDGKLQNTVIRTFPNVSQFWTYKAEEYLRTPSTLAIGRRARPTDPARGSWPPR